MKKVLLTLAAVALGATYVFAQGQVTWGNQFSTTTYIPIYGVNPAAPDVALSGQSALGKPVGSTVYGGPLLQGTGYTMGFFINNAGVTDPFAAGWTMLDSVGFRTTTGTGLPGGLVANISGKVLTITGHDAGTSINYQMRVWDNKGGTITTWAGLLAINNGANPLLGTVAAGWSSIGTVAALAGTDVGGNLFAPTSTTGWTSFQLTQVVPEPATFALAGLGAAAMLIFRRRK